MHGQETLLENVQRRFTRRLEGMRGLNYEQRFWAIKLTKLQQRRIYHDMTLVYKLMRNLLSSNLHDVGFQICDRSSTRSNGIRLKHCKPATSHLENIFKSRAPIARSSLPAKIIGQRTLPSFKKSIKKHLFL